VKSREWRLDDLLAMFPESSRGTRRVLRCLWRVTGEGRSTREVSGVTASAAVSLTARPADQFSFRLTCPWPKGLGLTEAHPVEAQLLRGILEGTVGCEDPPWRCRLECTSLDFSSLEDAAPLVREAAFLAVQDLVQGGGWEATGGPGDHVA
jgi:hypothetical protein